MCVTISQTLAHSADMLRDARIDNPMHDARILFCHASGIALDRLTFHLQDCVNLKAKSHFDGFIARRIMREPVSHIIARRLFWGRSFVVGPDVLDPRPETEVLIAQALLKPFTRVLDLGVGSGAILLSLLAENPNALGVGVDLSSAALAVAQQNASRLGVSQRVDLRCGSWFEPVKGRFDLIVANPPYIALDEMAALSLEVVRYEPRLALTDEGDGLSHYRHILAHIRDYLAPLGRVLFEVGANQAREVINMCHQAGFNQVDTIRDFDGKDRVISAYALV